jgi:hypothetical protein
MALSALQLQLLQTHGNSVAQEGATVLVAPCSHAQQVRLASLKGQPPKPLAAWTVQQGLHAQQKMEASSCIPVQEEATAKEVLEP